MDEIEQQFADGNVSAVVRVGDTVRREVGPWTLAVHDLLRHLEAKGFSYAPRLLGTDAQGREMLSFVPGDTISPSLEGYRGDDTLIAAATLLRRYHDAVAGFVPPPGAVWRFAAFTPQPGDIICHNDFAPWNVVMQNGQVSGLIDWDFAGPGTRLWDIAYALWRFVPLYPAAEFGPPAERARRIAVFCAAYGPADYADLLSTIRARQIASYTALKTWAEAGQPAWVKQWQEGHADGILADLAYLEQNWPDLQPQLESAP